MTSLSNVQLWRPRTQLPPCLGKSNQSFMDARNSCCTATRELWKKINSCCLNINLFCLYVKLWNCMSGKWATLKRNPTFWLKVPLSTAVGNGIKTIWSEFMAVESKDCRRYLNNNNTSCSIHCTAVISIQAELRTLPAFGRPLPALRRELQSQDSIRGLKSLLYQKTFCSFKLAFHSSSVQKSFIKTINYNNY